MFRVIMSHMQKCINIFLWYSGLKFHLKVSSLSVKQVCTVAEQFYLDFLYLLWMFTELTV